MMPTLCLDHFYTAREKIPVELDLRRQLLPPKAGNPLEELLLSRRHAVILRNVLTPNFEIMRFVSLATEMGFHPLMLEFYADKYVVINAAKACLGQMSFSYAGGVEIEDCPSVRVVDPDQYNGRPFSTVKTLSGEGLIGFHHDLVNETTLRGKIDHYDASGWIAAQGGKAAVYYEAVFRLFIAHAVLFESYLNKGRDQAFTEKIVFPAFDAAVRHEGVKPLICRLDPPDSEGSESWYNFPTELYPHVAGKAASWAAGGNRKSGHQSEVLH